MIHIAICDDEEVFVEKIRSEARAVLETQDEDFEIFCYTDGNKLLADYETKKFDLILLDIDMPDVDGFEVAEKLNKINEKIIIGFVTSRDDLVFDVFNLSFEIYAFIRKSNSLRELANQLQKMCNAFQKNKKSIVFKIFRSTIEVKILDILYFESFSHKIYMNYKKKDKIEQIQIIDKMDNIQQKTSKYNFIRVNSGCVVNPVFIDFIDKKEKTLILIDGKKLNISRYRINDVLKGFQISRRSL